MKLTLERDALLAALTRTVGVVSRRSTIEILRHVRIETGDGCVNLIVTNLDIQASISVPARIETPGSTTVAAERLREICSRLPEGAEILIDAMDPLRAKIKAGRSNFSVGALPSADFPMLTEPTGGSTLELPAGDMLRLFAIGSDCMGAAQPLDCCLIEVLSGMVRCVSTDRGTMTVCDVSAGAFELERGTKIGAEAVAVLVRALGGMVATDPATLTILPGKMLAASLGGMDIIGRVVDGDYPPYLRVIPEKSDSAFTVDVDTFTAMLRRAQIASPHVDIELTAGKMEIRARDQAAGDSSEEETESDWTGIDRRIAIKADNLLGLLAHVRTESAVIQTDGPMRPMLVTETRDSDWLGCIMPLVGSK